MSIFTACYQGILDVIRSTFIVDDRYKIWLQGIENTLIITVGALVLGVAIGIFVAVSRVYYYQSGQPRFWESLKLFKKTGRSSFIGQAFLKVLDDFLNLYLTIFRGTPVVVQIMFWTFVVFSSINEVPVAIIGLGINSGAYVSEIIRAGIISIDKGQTEAGRSLGLSAWQTMRLIVLPQAIKNVLPALFNEIISLLKETSIVGYVAVVDVTKASQLVRARTFDAFVPLLFVAAFYLILVIVLGSFQKRLEARLHSSDRK